MKAKMMLDRNELVEILRSLTPLQRQLLTNIAERGPGLMLEIAVRVLKFPEEVSTPLRDLQSKNLIATDAITTDAMVGAQMGNELFRLSEQGRQAATLLRDETIRKQLESPPTNSAAQSAAPPDPRQQEVDLLRKLGDLAVEKGDLEKASTWYEQALEKTRSMTDPATKSTSTNP